MRSHQMMGFDSRYIPGWDCHGLPIEWKIEEEYRQKGKNKDDVPVNEFRGECRSLCRKVGRYPARRIQAPGRHRQLGRAVPDDGFPRRAGDRRGIHEIPDERHALSGLQARDVVAGRKTALAEAEVEYHDKESFTQLGEVPGGR